VCFQKGLSRALDTKEILFARFPHLDEFFVVFFLTLLARLDVLWKALLLRFESGKRG
jgi:hypothetical protein